MSEDKKHPIHRVYVDPRNGERPYLKTETPDHKVAQMAFNRIRKLYTPPNAIEPHIAIWNLRAPGANKADNLGREVLKPHPGKYDITDIYISLAND